jgi:phosphatidylethanolamine/phosphatidyl-N-methylethanolamine N-methyltransferase
MPVRSERALFLREFVRSPLRTASVVPSSPSLAEQMITALSGGDDSVVVELGPGTGIFTEAIQRRLDGRGRHIAIELNETMAAHVSRRCPGVELVTGAAADLPDILAARGITGADHIVSGLPWSAFAGTVGSALVDTIASALTPAGVYTQFTYAWTRWAPPAQRQLAQLRSAFAEVVITRTIWRNVPPAFVYVSRRPRTVAPVLVPARSA